MKKFLFMGAVAMLFMASCNDKDAATDNGNSAADKAKANNREVLKAIENGDVSKLDSFITSDGVDHSGSNGMMEIKGIDSIKKDLGSIKQNFSDLKFDVMQEAVNGDYLFVLSKVIGTTAANPGPGMRPNEKIEMTGVDVLKFNSEGKFTEHWTFNDPREMMKIMGGDKPADNKTAADTTKK